MIQTTRLAIPSIFVFIIGIALVFAQSHINATLPDKDAFLDVSFEQEKIFIDDVQINEIRFNNNNIQIAAIESISELPLDMIIIIDSSGSQIPSWDLISQFYAKMIETLPLRRIDSACLVSANNNINVVQGPTFDKTLLLEGFKSLTFMGNTKLLDAIYLAGKQFDNQRNSRKAMVIVSDGEDNASSIKIKDVYRTAIANNVRIYLFLRKGLFSNISNIRLFSNINNKQIQAEMHKKYVARTGGKIFPFSDLKSGQDQFMQMLNELSHLKRIKLSTKDAEWKQSRFEISISRKGVTAYYPSPLK